MARKASNLICKCGRKGGFLTKRKAGYGNKHEYYYVGHYDHIKKGRTWCSISEHDLAHIQFDDVRYCSEYIPLIQELKNLYKSHATKELIDEVWEKAQILLFRMYKRLDAEMIVAKSHADFMELYILEKIQKHGDEGLTTDHNVLWRWFHDLPVTPQRLWSNHPHYKDWPKSRHLLLKTANSSPTSP